MPTNLVVNGTSFPYPETGDELWGDPATDWAIAVTNGMLQKAGGLFTLTAEVDFGTSFGLKSVYFKSRATNPASAGILRVGNNQVALAARNAANSGDVTLTVDTSDIFQFSSTGRFTAPSTGYAAKFARTAYDEYGLYFSAGTGLTVRNVTDSRDEMFFVGDGTIKFNQYTTGLAHFDSAGLVSSSLLVNADVHASAAIAYSKLNLSASIVNADISASAAIAYSKLNLSGGIVNADINASAAIAFSKINPTLAADADFGSSFGIYAAYFGASSGTRSTVGTFRLANNTNVGWRNQSNSANITIGVSTADRFVFTGGKIEAPSYTTAGALYVDGSNIFQSEAALDATRGGTSQSTYTQGDLLYASAANTLSKRAIGSAGQLLTTVSSVPTWRTTPSLSAHRNGSNQTSVATNNSDVVVAFNSVAATLTVVGYDTASAFDTANSYYAVPVAGKWKIHAQAFLLSTNVLNNRYRLIIKVGTSTYAAATEIRDGVSLVPSATTAFSVEVNATLNLAAGDRIFIGFFGQGDNSASNLTIEGTTTRTVFEVEQVAGS